MSWRRLLKRRAIETAVVGVAAVLALVVLLSPSMAAPSVQYLHAADVLVVSTTYNTMTGSVGSPGTNATAPMTRNQWTTFTQGGVSILVSDPVPAGEQWAIGGAWSFTAWISNTARNGVQAQARATIYKITTGGTSEALATTAVSNITMNLAFGSFTWAHTLAANTLAEGERFGVEFQLRELDGRSGSANLRLDDAAAASTVTAQVAVTSVPGAPQTVAATAGNAEATVTWAAPASNGGSAITGYTVTPSPADVAPVTVNGSTFTATLTGLTNGTSYTFTVVATNAIGDGPGATSNAVTPSVPATAPGAPQNVAATAGNAQATVTWTAPTLDGGSAITGYTVTPSPADVVAATVDGSTFTATLTGLTNGTSYTFTVVATNAVGSGPGTASNAVTPTAGATVPGAPQSVAATAGISQATVTWAAPASDGGSAITGYTVTPNPPHVAPVTVNGSTLTATVTGLTNGTSYTFTVVATNAIGDGPSATSNAVTPTSATVPGAPQSVAATAGNAEATVTWAAPASDGGSAITGYTVSPSPAGVTPVTVNGSTFTATLTGLTNGTAYTFTVVATNAIGNGPGATSNSVTPSAGVPGAPQSVAATAGNAQATVTWAAPASDGGSAITGYTVTPSPAHVAPVTVNGSTFTATLTALSNGTSYTFTVVATNAIGNGPGATSNAVTPTDATAPGTPQNVVATAGNAQATVTWAAPLSDGNSPITSYTVTSSPADATPAIVGPSTFSVTLTGLTNGTAYTFTVVATNAIGNGPGATSAAVTPLTTPGAPTAVTAVPGDRQATLTWTAPADGGGQITQYTVTPNPVAAGATGLVVTGTPAATTTIVRELTNGTAYTFTVTATNVGGTGPASAASNSVTPTNDRYLHAADVTVGTATYNTMNAVQGSGPLATVSSILARDVDTLFTDAASISLFASEPVPAGATWDIAGTWTYRAYVRTSAAIRVNLRARVYTITSGGVATLHSQSTLTSQVDATTSYQLVTWTHAVPTALLNGGERFGVDFMVRSIENTSGEIAYIGFDTAMEPSLVRPVIVENSAPGRVRQGYYRFGKDRPLAAMEWMGGVDSPATNVAKNQAIRYRILAYNDGATATNWQPNLEWSTSATTGWAAVPTVEGAPPFFVYDTVHYENGANGAAIVPAQFGLEYAIGTAVEGVAYDTVNPGGSLTLPGDSYTEVEFSIWVTSTPADGATYYLRVTNNATPLATYDAGTASVTIAYPWPTPPANTPPAHNLHQQYSADTAACAACHRVHTSPAPTVLYKAWPEENVCFTCHDGSAAPDIQTPFARAYKMPITSTAGVHSKDEPRLKNSANFSAANRHVECADCHNPHLAGAGNHTVGTNYAAGPQQGVWGVGVSNVTPWAAPTYTPVTEVTMQYQLCFKCHSSWAYGTSPPTTPSGGFAQTNQAKEFNTLNNAYHPVEDVGKNPFTTGGGTSYASSLIGGFTPTSRMVCTDCHMSDQAGDAAGPHGSASPFILRGAWNRTTGNAGTQNHLCFNCHAWTTYGPGGTGPTGFSDAGTNLHGIMVGGLNKANGDAPIVCMDCHVAIPHGYNRDHLLGFTGDGAPYIDRPYVGGLVVIDQWRASGQWTFSSCSTAMNSCK